MDTEDENTSMINYKPYVLYFTHSLKGLRARVLHYSQRIAYAAFLSSHDDPALCFWILQV